MPSSQVFQGDEIPELGRYGSGELVFVKPPARGAPWRKEGVGGGRGLWRVPAHATGGQFLRASPLLPSREAKPRRGCEAHRISSLTRFASCGGIGPMSWLL